MTDRYGADVLAGDWRKPPRGRSQQVPAATGLVVEEVETGWCGAVVSVEKSGGMRVVHLEDRRGRIRAFPMGPGFLIDGAPVELIAPVPAAEAAALQAAREAASRTASGSRAVADTSARIARGSRIFVEGKHDAELVEKVWGADLRIEGVVVEPLHGVDDLRDVIRDFAPSPSHRLGVLVDHLVPGTKEARIVQDALAIPEAHRDVLVVGHPYVDVWQSIRPERLGWEKWPVIPRGMSWKHGILAALGWPHETQADVATGWQRMLGTVRSYTDLQPELLGRVEELIDFVTAVP
ncbi:DUF3097 domain-containing protein [Flexivirga caeni]|uniref:DUF3097 domain-containing protein n=1 Tax=Flexivirga caeni TaxID=2294115 RepID=UPI001C65777E|nr:DUF3097 domain-containing protein [Flexivirga caeni]